MFINILLSNRVGLCFPRGLSQVSAVCAYSVTSIRDIFSEGKFKTPVAVETSHVKWVMYTGEVPVPRPGAVSLNKHGPIVTDMKSNLQKF